MRLRAWPQAAVAVTLTFAVAACSANVRVRYPAPAPGVPTGTITIVFSETAAHVAISVDGRLVTHVDRADKVRIDDCEVGYRDVVVVAGPLEKTMRIWVDPGRETSVPVASPGDGGVETLQKAVLSAITLLLYAWLF